MKRLFTNERLDKTIDFIFKKVHNENKIQKNVPNSLKRITTSLHQTVTFHFQYQYLLQRDGVAMGSPLGPLVTNTLMESVQEDPIPTLTEWKIGTLRNLSK